MEETDTFITTIVVMVSWVYAYVQIHQIVYIKYVQFFCITIYTSIKLLKERKEGGRNPGSGSDMSSLGLVICHHSINCLQGMDTIALAGQFLWQPLHGGRVGSQKDAVRGI